MDFQKYLDEWLAERPEAQKYVSKLYYVPEGQQPPADATHKGRVSSLASAERAVTVAAVAKPEFVVVFDMILAMLSTQPKK
jgi:hypothetical protein